MGRPSECLKRHLCWRRRLQEELVIDRYRLDNTGAWPLPVAVDVACVHGNARGHFVVYLTRNW